MMKKCLYFLLSLALCLSLMSCATKTKVEYITTTETVTETVTQTEYVPTYTDLTETVKTMFTQRPDNSSYTVKTGAALSLFDLVKNSISYQSAWLDWQTYAEALEDTLVDIRNSVADPSAELEPLQKNWTWADPLEPIPAV